jgi:hypothetical protein
MSTGDCKKSLSELLQEAELTTQQAADARKAYLSSKLPQAAAAQEVADKAALQVSLMQRHFKTATATHCSGPLQW